MPKPEFSSSKLIIFKPNGTELTRFPLKSGYDSASSDSSSSSSEESDEASEAENKTDENEIKINKKEEQLALDALNNWKEITGVPLVPEHVETRSLYNPNTSPDLEQGKIQLWIDIFPISDYKIGYTPKPLDVSIRKPKKFQLRVIIFNTKDVILDDTNVITGEKSSDIYVKGFLCDKLAESQKTDVHYRSLNGEGNFNWRFLFNFDYLPAEKRIVYTQKKTFGFTSIERKVNIFFFLFKLGAIFIYRKWA